MWPDGTHPMLFAVICMPSFRPIAPVFFLAEVPFLASFLIHKGVWPQRHTQREVRAKYWKKNLAEINSLGTPKSYKIFGIF